MDFRYLRYYSFCKFLGIAGIFVLVYFLLAGIQVGNPVFFAVFLVAAGLVRFFEVPYSDDTSVSFNNAVRIIAVVVLGAGPAAIVSGLGTFVGSFVASQQMRDDTQAFTRNIAFYNFGKSVIVTGIVGAVYALLPQVELYQPLGFGHYATIFLLYILAEVSSEVIKRIGSRLKKGQITSHGDRDYGAVMAVSFFNFPISVLIILYYNTSGFTGLSISLTVMIVIFAVFNKMGLANILLRESIGKLSIINEASKSLNAVTNIELLFEIIYQQCSKIVDTSIFEILIYIEKRNELSVEFEMMHDQRQVKKKYEAGRGLASVVVEKKVPVLIADIDKAEGHLLRQGIAMDEEIQSYLGVPMISEGEVVGIISIINHNKYAFEPENADVLSIFANQAAAAMKNTIYYDQLVKHKTRLEEIVSERTLELEISNKRLLDINEIVKTLNYEDILETLFKKILDKSISIIPSAERGTFIVKNRFTNRFEYVAAEGWDLDVLSKYTFTEQTIRKGFVDQFYNPSLISDFDDLDFPLFGEEFEEKGITLKKPRSVLNVPIMIDRKLVAVLSLHCMRSNGFRNEDVETMSYLKEHFTLAYRRATDTEELIMLNKEIKEKEKVKSGFLANMSHELRTPLNSIIGFTKLIMEDLDEKLHEKQINDLKAVHVSALHLLQLITEILDLSKIEAGKMELKIEEFDINEVLYEVLLTASGLLKNDTVKFTKDIPDDLPLVKADKFRIRQVLLNLVNNSIKFTEAGVIHIRASHLKFEKAVQVSVEDTGIGIDKSDYPKVFEAFRQIDGSLSRSVGGTGLGLSICKKLIEMSGGKIWFSSKFGVGSTFYISIPSTEKVTLLQGSE